MQMLKWHLRILPPPLPPRLGLTWEDITPDQTMFLLYIYNEVSEESDHPPEYYHLRGGGGISDGGCTLQ